MRLRNARRPEPGSSIAILETGALGLAAVVGAVVSGCATIISIDRIDSRLEMAKRAIKPVLDVSVA